MSGESECRIRSSGPMPGKNPNTVGDMLAANCSRFPWRTKRPPENWLRIMKGPADVVFTTETPGCSFHVPVNSGGRLIPVCQSIAVANVWPYSTRRTPPGTVESGMKNSWRALLIWSVTLTLFAQLQRPTRSGVCRLRSVCRVSEKSASVSTPPPPVPGASRNVGPTWKVWALLNANPGDHVIDGVMFTGDGVRLTRGKFWLTRSLARFCDRLPPTLRVPQSNRLSKFTCEVSCAVAT